MSSILKFIVSLLFLVVQSAHAEEIHCKYSTRLLCNCPESFKVDCGPGWKGYIKNELRVSALTVTVNGKDYILAPPAEGIAEYLARRTDLSANKWVTDQLQGKVKIVPGKSPKIVLKEFSTDTNLAFYDPNSHRPIPWPVCLDSKAKVQAGLLSKPDADQCKWGVETYWMNRSVDGNTPELGVGRGCGEEKICHGVVTCKDGMGVQSFRTIACRSKAGSCDPLSVSDCIADRTVGFEDPQTPVNGILEGNVPNAFPAN